MVVDEGMKNWNLQKVHEIIDEYSDEYDEYLQYVHRYFDELKERKRYAVEIEFKNEIDCTSNDKIFGFKKKIEKQGLYCGFNENYFTVIVSTFPNIVKIMCYVAIPTWENSVVRGLFFGYRPREINKFMDQFKKKEVMK